MKTIKHIFLAGLAIFAFTSCMNDFDEPNLEIPPYGNNTIGEPNMTITEFKEKYKNELKQSAPTEITENIILKGIVVANDETGNVYKQIVINDGGDAIIIGVNGVGLYANLPIGQMIAIDCKGLSCGGYGKLPQIGEPYNTEKYGIQIGRMSDIVFKEHIKLIGEPYKEHNDLVPTVLTEAFLSDASNKDLCPRFVIMKGVEFTEADGKRLFAPEKDVQNNVVERHVKIGNNEVIFRLSSYADFANAVIPTGKLDITGVLTRYNNYWQFMLNSDKDITPAE